MVTSTNSYLTTTIIFIPGMFYKKIIINKINTVYTYIFLSLKIVIRPFTHYLLSEGQNIRSGWLYYHKRLIQTTDFISFCFYTALSTHIGSKVCWNVGKHFLYYASSWIKYWRWRIGHHTARAGKRNMIITAGYRAGLLCFTLLVVRLYNTLPSSFEF